MDCLGKAERDLEIGGSGAQVGAGGSSSSVGVSLVAKRREE